MPSILLPCGNTASDIYKYVIYFFTHLRKITIINQIVNFNYIHKRFYEHLNEIFHNNDVKFAKFLTGFALDDTNEHGYHPELSYDGHILALIVDYSGEGLNTSDIICKEFLNDLKNDLYYFPEEALKRYFYKNDLDEFTNLEDLNEIPEIIASFNENDTILYNNGINSEYIRFFEKEFNSFVTVSNPVCIKLIGIDLGFGCCSYANWIRYY